MINYCQVSKTITHFFAYIWCSLFTCWVRMEVAGGDLSLQDNTFWTNFGSKKKNIKCLFLCLTFSNFPYQPNFGIKKSLHCCRQNLEARTIFNGVPYWLKLSICWNDECTFFSDASGISGTHPDQSVSWLVTNRPKLFSSTPHPGQSVIELA